MASLNNLDSRSNLPAEVDRESYHRSFWGVLMLAAIIIALLYGLSQILPAAGEVNDKPRRCPAGYVERLTCRSYGGDMFCSPMCVKVKQVRR